MATDILNRSVFVHETSNVDKNDGEAESVFSLRRTLSTALGEQLAARKLVITTAESCTGGLIAAALTEVPGSSGWFEQGIVSYSNRVKHELLDVPLAVFETDGAVSEACVCAMASGALRRANADVAIAVSGIAGPDGATPGKPVGTVWLAWAFAGQEVTAASFHFAGDRTSVRAHAVVGALRGTISRLQAYRSSVS